MANPDKRMPKFNLGDPADDAPPPRAAKPAKKAPAKKPPKQPIEDETPQRALPTDKRKSQSVYLPQSIIDRARGIVYFAQGNALGEFSSLADLYTWALDRAFLEVEEQYNDGEPFKAPGRLSTGPGRGGVERIRQARRRAGSQLEDD